MGTLNLYLIFHLNLAYSAVSVEDRATVIQRCYWPLLRLLQRHPSLRIGITAPGYTLEQIATIDPSWNVALAENIARGRVEMLASGYVQLIGPLVPYLVNKKNLQLGTDIYREIAGVSPRVAYLNEQAYTRSLLANYREEGYEALVVEWNNAAAIHREWPATLQYYPQLACDGAGCEMPILWNNSIAFQKFQRYAHGEIDEDDYVRYLETHQAKERRYLCLYGSDTEVFDFRPGRFGAETEFVASNEWERIGHLLQRLAESERFRMVLPGDVLAEVPRSQYRKLTLESPEMPVLVKKQEKYRISRWALTGRGDLQANTACHRIFEHLRQVDDLPGGGNLRPEKLRRQWKTLCYLWSSDFRTHIEAKRYAAFKRLLAKTVAGTAALDGHRPDGVAHTTELGLEDVARETDKSVTVTTPSTIATWDKRRGLSLTSLTFPRVGDRHLVGTFAHGYYESIFFSGDFYSGHTVLEAYGSHKITDLGRVSPRLRRIRTAEGEFVEIEAEIKVPLGTITKKYRAWAEIARLDIDYRFRLSNVPPGALHTGYITLNPEVFERSSLYIACHNGGKELERHELGKVKNAIDPGPVTFLISARSCFGNTEGYFEIGDASTALALRLLWQAWG